MSDTEHDRPHDTPVYDVCVVDVTDPTPLLRDLNEHLDVDPPVFPMVDHNTSEEPDDG